MGDSEIHLIRANVPDTIEAVTKLLWETFGPNVREYVDAAMERGEIEVEDIVRRTFAATADCILHAVMSGDLCIEADNNKVGVQHGTDDGQTEAELPGAAPGEAGS